MTTMNWLQLLRKCVYLNRKPFAKLACLSCWRSQITIFPKMNVRLLSPAGIKLNRKFVAAIRLTVLLAGFLAFTTDRFGPRLCENSV